MPHFPATSATAACSKLAKQDALAGRSTCIVFHPVRPSSQAVLQTSVLGPLVPVGGRALLRVRVLHVALLAIRRGFVKRPRGPVAAAFVFLSNACSGSLGPRLAWYQRPGAILLGVMLAFLNTTLPTELSPRFRAICPGPPLAALVAAVTFFVGTGFARPLNVYVSSVPPGDSLKDGFYWVEISHARQSPARL